MSDSCRFFNRKSTFFEHLKLSLQKVFPCEPSCSFAYPFRNFFRIFTTFNMYKIQDTAFYLSACHVHLFGKW